MQFQKWLDQIEPQRPIAEAAAVALRQRLSAVAYFLPLAADRPDETSEHVHQLRVWCRRSLAAVNLYQDQLRQEDVDWFAKWLRRTRQAAGEARDLDVLLERHKKRLCKSSYHPLRSALRKLRKQAQQPIVMVNERIGNSGKLDRRINRSIESIARGHGECFQPWAEHKLNLATASFYSNLPGQKPSIDELHRFRISGKELRYAMELLARAFPSLFRQTLYPVVSQLQVRLGDLNDHAAAAERLKKLKKKHNSKQLKRLIAEEEQATAVELDAFHAWWTPHKTQEFFQLLQEITQPPKAS